MPSTALRPLTDADADFLFEMMRDPAGVRMAAFTAPDPSDRERFDAQFSRQQNEPSVIQFAITHDGALAGSIASFVIDGETEITYWIDRPLWGRGIAGEALALFLGEVKVRPLHARAASDNEGSLHVLRKAGFQIKGTEVSYAAGRGAEIEETILVLP
jgi:RimJ/RimL family protein N-acetyltransferase